MSSPLLAFIDGPEGIVVLVVLVLVFGANRVPKLARQLGQAQRELKKGMQEGFSGEHEDDDKKTSDAASPAVAASQLATNVVDTTAAEQPPHVELPERTSQPTVVSELPVSDPTVGEPVIVVTPANLRPPLPPPPTAP